jgi:hypothetical protein
VHELGLDFGCGQIGKDFAHQSQCGGDQKALLCLRPIAWWRAGASSFELLRYLFTNAPRQIVVVDYASRLVVEYHVTGIFPAATGPAVMGDVLNFQPSHNLEKNEQAKKNQKNLAAAPRDKAPRSAPHLFRSLMVGWQCEVPVLSKRIQSCAATITKRADALHSKRAPDTVSSPAYLSPSLTSCGIVVAKVRPIWENGSGPSGPYTTRPPPGHELLG